MAKITKENYAVVETNHVAAVRTGNMKAQYERAEGVEALENGMGVTVDEVKKEVRFIKDAGADELYLHASEEQIYEEHLGRDAFRNEGRQLPRVLKLEVGDIFETNAIDPALELTEGTKLFPNEEGIWAAATDITGKQAAIVEAVTLPNGETGAKLAIVNA